MANRRLFDSGFSNWSVKQLPNLSSRLFIITGGNSGIGFEAAKHLGKAGADVVLVCRNKIKADKAVQELQTKISGQVSSVQMDLSDLTSVRTAAEEIHTRFTKIDGLINNAGIMQIPKQKTVDGFEMQLGTNHLGHFLLSGLLIDMVEAAAGRIVTLSSIAQLSGVINFGDLMSDKDYAPMIAYSQSKAANLLFALELDRRLQGAGSSAISIACHPGYTNTNLQNTGPTGFFKLLYKVLNPLFAQSGPAGALPTVLGAAGTEAKRGGYYGPQSMGGLRGPVSDAIVASRHIDLTVQKRLWEESEKLVGHKWGI
jgi:NAD(P)-dependent dehydrogenase (short-subunit alcohol dehydrogenase family)